MAKKKIIAQNTYFDPSFYCIYISLNYKFTQVKTIIRLRLTYNEASLISIILMIYFDLKGELVSTVFTHRQKSRFFYARVDKN